MKHWRRRVAVAWVTPCVERELQFGYDRDSIRKHDQRPRLMLFEGLTGMEIDCCCRQGRIVGRQHDARAIGQMHFHRGREAAGRRRRNQPHGQEARPARSRGGRTSWGRGPGEFFAPLVEGGDEDLFLPAEVGDGQGPALGEPLESLSPALLRGGIYATSHANLDCERVELNQPSQSIRRRKRRGVEPVKRGLGSQTGFGR